MIYLPIFYILCFSLGLSVQESARYAPIPQTGNGLPIDPKIGYAVENFGAGAYMVTDNIYQAMFSM